jgi:hypothetical protein
MGAQDITEISLMVGKSFKDRGWGMNLKEEI